MTRNRKRARPGPSLGRACAYARLEDRLLLSTMADEGVGRVPVSHAPVRAAYVAIAVGETSSNFESPDAWVTPANVPPMPSRAGVWGAAPVQMGEAPTVESPEVALDVTAGRPGPMGTARLEAAPVDPPLIGDRVGPRAVGIDGPVLRSVEAHYAGYSPLGDAALGLLPMAPALPCASMASIVGLPEIALAEVAAPPAVLQPMAAPAMMAGPYTAPPGPAAGPAPAEPPAGPGPTDEAPAVEPAEAEAATPPDPIGAGLRLTAPLVDVAGWDEALGRLVAGVDDLAEGLGEVGGTSAMLPWAVGAGLTLAASEVARRARRRPRLAAVFVDGSASVIGPDDAPGDRARSATASRSVRSLLARGLSRWTTRR